MGLASNRHSAMLALLSELQHQSSLIAHLDVNLERQRERVRV